MTAGELVGQTRVPAVVGGRQNCGSREASRYQVTPALPLSGAQGT